MKKLRLLVMPLIATSLLASCGGSKQIKYHTIIFHSNDGSEVPTLIVENGKLAVEPKRPTKDAMKFAGWYTEDTLENYFNFSTKIEKDYDLYARWEGEFEYKATLEADDKLTLETEGGFFDQSDFTSRILLKDEYRNKYDLPYSKDYYEVTVNDSPIDNFEIEQVIDGSPTEYYVNITIPKESLGYDIEIKTEPYCHYLTFTAVEDGAKVYWTRKSSYEYPILAEIQYCTDLTTEDWIDWKIGADHAFTFAEAGDTIYVKNKTNEFSRILSAIIGFETGDSSSPKIAAGGNIMSLLNFNNLHEECFMSLFSGCESLVVAPKLPATTLEGACYNYMFKDCSLLTVAPKLPATILSYACYFFMFSGCSSLVAAPNLPAKKLENDCYGTMFDGCSSLKINNVGHGNKFFTCPLDISPDRCIENMFTSTGGDYTADPVAGESYYYTID